MNKKILNFNYSLFFLLAFLIFFPIMNGCSDPPLDVLHNPLEDGALNAWTGTMVLFDDLLQTNGDIMLGPINENHDIKEVNDAYKGEKALKYTWNGEKVSGKDFCYISFIAAVGDEFYDLTEGKDLRYGGYTKITLYAKGWVDNNAEIEFKGPKRAIDTADTNTVKIIPGVNDCPPLDRNIWQKYKIDITNSDLTEVKDYFVVAFVRKGETSGGEVFIDDVKYE